MGQHVFVIGPIGEPGSPVRRRADDLFELVVSPSLSAYNSEHPDDPPIEAKRADLLHEPALITHQVVQLIADSAFVIVDTAGHNPNVFYELGLAEAFHVPTIRIADSEEQIPFDTRDHRTLFLDSRSDGTLEARAVREAVEQMHAQISAVLADGYVLASVVASAGQHALLTKQAEALHVSEDPVMNALGQLADAINRVAGEVDRMSGDLDRLGVPGGRIFLPPITTTSTTVAPTTTEPTIRLEPTTAALLATTLRPSHRQEGAPESLEHLDPESTGVGRNDPCPCGSGRKYKMCHGRA